MLEEITGVIVGRIEDVVDFESLPGAAPILDRTPENSRVLVSNAEAFWGNQFREERNSNRHPYATATGFSEVSITQISLTNNYTRALIYGQDLYDRWWAYGNLSPSSSVLMDRTRRWYKMKDQFLNHMTPALYKEDFFDPSPALPPQPIFATSVMQVSNPRLELYFRLVNLSDPNNLEQIQALILEYARAYGFPLNS